MRQNNASLFIASCITLCVLVASSNAYIFQEVYADDQCSLLTTANVWADNSCIQSVKRTCSNGISTTQDFPSNDATCSTTPATTVTGNPQCANRKREYCQDSYVPRGFLGVSTTFYVNAVWSNGANCKPANTSETDYLSTLYRTDYCIQRTSSSSFHTCINGIPAVKTCNSVNDCSCTAQFVNTSTVCSSLGGLTFVTGCYTPSDASFIPMPIAPPMAPSPKAAPMAAPVAAPVVAPVPPALVPTPTPTARPATRAPFSEGTTTVNFVPIFVLFVCSVAMMML